jgi:hypothetical protein
MKWSSRLAVATASLVLVSAAPAWAANVNPTAMDYGSQKVGASSAAATFQLATSGTQCVDNGSGGCAPGLGSTTTDTSALGGGPGTTTRSGDFEIYNQTCGYPSQISGPVPYSSSYCSFQATFVPAAAGSRAMTLNFPDSGGPTGSLALSGTGLSTGSTTLPTGQRAAAIKKCKKKFPKGSARRKRCLRHAGQLPV